MGTRSMIGMVEDDGTVTAIYCHWDGHPKHNGLLLRKHWYDAYLIDHLMHLGNLSYLGKEIGECQDFDQPTDLNWCLAYGRDRNEPNQTATSYYSRDEYVSNAAGDHCADYIYLWEKDMWRCWNYDGVHINLNDMNVEA